MAATPGSSKRFELIVHPLTSPPWGALLLPGPPSAQVESLSGLLQSMEAPAVGESRSGHFGRQMAYMMGVLQAKAREVAALREGGAAATGGGGDSRLAEEVDALEEAYGAETVAAWAAIEEFREELMRFDTELASAVGSLQAEVADVRLRAEAGKRGKPAAARGGGGGVLDVAVHLL